MLERFAGLAALPSTDGQRKSLTHASRDTDVWGWPGFTDDPIGYEIKAPRQAAALETQCWPIRHTQDHFVTGKLIVFTRFGRCAVEIASAKLIGQVDE